MSLETFLAILFGVAFAVSTAAHFLRPNRPELADELDTAKEALDVGCHVLTKVLGGAPLDQALADLPHDPEAVDVFHKALALFPKPAPKDGSGGSAAVRVSILFLALALSLGASGCASLAADEAVAFRALDKLEQAVDWANADPDALNALLDDAAAAAPGNATLQAAVARAKAANTAGDRSLALAIIKGGKVVLAPAPSPTQAAGQ